MSDNVGPGEAARRLGVSTRTIQRWLREGRLPAVKVGGRLKVDASALPRPSSAGPDGAESHREIRRLLVANRGELVVRIARTCRRLGIRCLALVPQDQADAWWTGAADELVALEGSYLEGERVIEAAVRAGADAIHPGYGFLAENPDFADAVERAGLIWVGPPASAMRLLGDKASARRLAARSGVPVLDGYDGDDQSDQVLRAEAERIGLPVMLKPSAGGGGKGMHVVHSPADLIDQLARARREAMAAFGDDRLVLERHVETPRHVEIQLLCDSRGNAVHLGERECSLQRRHQKVIEEAPSPAVSAELRRQLGDAATALAREAGYVGAGTAEFLLGRDGRFHFLELNARLQVEHPVTELVTGRDLVADQLRVAAGHELGFGQDEVRLTGHAVEGRLYAEDPDHDFLPAAGPVDDVRWPATEGVRVDAGVGSGDVIGTRYDPLLAKVIAHAGDRQAALDLLDGALAQTTVLGVTTNRGFLRWLLRLPEVRRGEMNTQLIDGLWAGRDVGPSDELWRIAAAALVKTRSQPSTAVPVGFRLNAPVRLRLRIGDEERSVEPDIDAADVHWAASGEDELTLDHEGRAFRARIAPPPTVEAATGHAHHGAASDTVTAPMPGSVLQVHVAEGDEVEAGQLLLVLEAMKMENGVTAHAAGRVSRVLVEVGQQVQRGDRLVEVA